MTADGESQEADRGSPGWSRRGPALGLTLQARGTVAWATAARGHLLLLGVTPRGRERAEAETSRSDPAVDHGGDGDPWRVQGLSSQAPGSGEPPGMPQIRKQEGQRSLLCALSNTLDFNHPMFQPICRKYIPSTGGESWLLSLAEGPSLHLPAGSHSFPSLHPISGIYIITGK